MFKLLTPPLICSASTLQRFCFFFFFTPEAFHPQAKQSISGALNPTCGVSQSADVKSASLLPVKTLARHKPRPNLAACVQESCEPVALVRMDGVCKGFTGKGRSDASFRILRIFFNRRRRRHFPRRCNAVRKAFSARVDSNVHKFSST